MYTPLPLSLLQLESSQNIESYFRRGRLAAEKEDHRAAVYYLDRCLDAAPHCLLFKTMRAEALALCKKYDDAHSVCK